MTAERQIGDTRDTVELRPGIAAVVSLAGEEPRIGSALRSTAWADKQLAVDLGSSDATIRECGAHGVTVVGAEEFPAEIARLGVDWVLLLDGHEEVPSALVRKIRDTVSVDGSNKAPVGYRVQRSIQFLGRTLRSRRWAVTQGVRLVRRDAVAWHECALGMDTLSVRGRVGCLTTPLVAEPYVTLRHYVSRMDILTTVAARARYRAGVPARWGDLIIKPAWLGLRALPSIVARDGTAGIILAVLESYRLVLVSAKHWELEHPDGTRAQV